jgi:hypothetical protein
MSLDPWGLNASVSTSDSRVPLPAQRRRSLEARRAPQPSAAVPSPWAGDGEEAAAKRTAAMGGVRDEGQLRDERFGVH